MNDSKDDKPQLSDIGRAPTSLSSARSATVPTEDYERLLDRFTAVTQEKEEIAEENANLRRHNNTTAILDELIKPYASRTFVFMCSYCVGVAAIIIGQALGCFKLPLSDGVMQLLVGSTAATVIGLVGMVLTGIFVGARRRYANSRDRKD